MNAMKFFFLAGVTLAAPFRAMAQEPVLGVIITAQNSHNWPVSHQAIKMTLENSRLFSLDVAVSHSLPPVQGE